MPLSTLAPRPLLLALAAAAGLALAACGGGGDDATDATADAVSADDATAAAAPGPASELAPSPEQDASASIESVATADTLHVGITIPGWPNKVDVYRPAGATRAVVFLHGRGGSSGQMARDLGLSSTARPPVSANVNWDWLARNKLIAVFPQGLVSPDTGLSGWSNYITDSGQDDVAFLKALASYVKAQYGATEASLAGHSNGGAMTARMWCEATASYKAYVTLAGPMPSTTYPKPSPTCVPKAPAPYYAIVGGHDSQLAKFSVGAMDPTPTEMAAGLTNSILVSEWIRHQDRNEAVCSQTPALQSESVVPSGPTWNGCSTRIRYEVVSKADHPIASLEQYAGFKMVDAIAAFVK